MPLSCSLQMVLQTWSRPQGPQISAHRTRAPCPTPLELLRAPCTSVLLIPHGGVLCFKHTLVILSSLQPPNDPSLLTTHQHQSQVNVYLHYVSLSVMPSPSPLAPPPQVRSGILGWFLLQRWLFWPLVSLHVSPPLAQLPE